MYDIPVNPNWRIGILTMAYDIVPIITGRFGPESSRQTLVSPIFRSSLVPSVADSFRRCIGDKSATLNRGEMITAHLKVGSLSPRHCKPVLNFHPEVIYVARSLNQQVGNS